ncbi:hypothetical protein F8388_015310 [Cannabis sativa]|uniref:O-fucosyltransferase family protein n=1 Tax=Cannabis sativa TaxID=3483 RepID=A0A7J6F405_CANSA|nr:hypothetical protein F8388_015310 [Cannabis sativa]
MWKMMMAYYTLSVPRSEFWTLPTLPLLLSATQTSMALLFLVSSLLSTNGSLFSYNASEYIAKLKRPKYRPTGNEKYLYWGNKIDCPGKHCDSCEGLGHQESSLRCALEEAMFLQRTFVMPSRMCINPIHNKKGILHQQASNESSDERWAANSCAMDSLYDMDFISETVPVILDNSKLWHQVLSTSMKLGSRGIAHLEGVNRVELKENDRYSNLLLINRTASRLSWFMECKDRNNRSAIMLPYSFLPSMAAANLRIAAEKIKARLGDYAAIHVRRGDKIKTRKDRFGVERSLHPHLDRDTRAEFILHRIAKWVPPGQTLFMPQMRGHQDLFTSCCEVNPCHAHILVLLLICQLYKLAYSSNYSNIIDPLIENNYQLFMIERLILYGAKTVIKHSKKTTQISASPMIRRRTPNYGKYQYIPWMKSEGKAKRIFGK